MKRHLTSTILLSLLCVSTQAATTAAPEHLQLELKGSSSAEQKNIATLLRLNKKHYLPNLINNRQQALLAINTVQANIKLALQPYGYFTPKINYTLRQEKHRWICRIHITHGQPVRYDKIELIIDRQALPKKALAELAKKWPIKKGDRFTSTSYNAAKTLLSNLANAYGFFDYTFKATRLSIHPETKKAHVYIKVLLGPRYRVANTTFHAPGFKRRFLHRFLRYQKNTSYQADDINKTRSDMINSRLFSSVNVVVNPNHTQKNVAISTKLTGLPSQIYSVGAGAGTDTGLRALFSTTFNNIDDEGSAVRLLARGSKVNYALLASYQIPGRNPANDRYSITTSIRKMDEAVGKSFAKRIAGSHSTRFGKWTLSTTLNFLRERYNLHNIPATNTDLVYPEISMQYLSTDNNVFPTQGIGVTASIDAASRALLSKISFIQYNFNFNTVNTPIKWLRTVFKARFGYTQIKHINNIPLSLQPMVGGTNSIRGYTYNSIYGGRELFTASGELQFRLVEKWYLAGFYDIGNVGNNLLKGRFKVGTGPAVMWVSPIGPVELSVARTVSEPIKTWKVQISMGTEL